MRIAFLGTGLLGKPMAERLLVSGQRVTYWNRTKEKAESLRAFGGEGASFAADAIGSGEVVILMLSDALAIKEVILSDDCRAALSGKTVLQMGTISPTESEQIAAQVVELGGEYFEAPVLGSINEAKNGRLVVMVGGTNEQYSKHLEIFKCLSQNPVFVGPVGKAALLKLSLNQLIGSLTTSFSLSLGMVERGGVNVELFMEILRASALYAQTFDKKLLRMLDRDFANPNFPAKHLLKDLGLIAQTASNMDLNVTAVNGVREILEQTIKNGYGDCDYSALYAAVNPSSSASICHTASSVRSRERAGDKP